MRVFNKTKSMCLVLSALLTTSTAWATIPTGMYVFGTSVPESGQETTSVEGITLTNGNASAITFADSKVKEICVAKWDTNGDGDLSYVEAAAVTSIGGAFKNNAEISSFNELKHFSALEGINDNAFADCIALKSITLPDGLKAIGQNAFAGTAITAIEIPASVNSIAIAAFNLTTALESISVAEGNAVYDSRNKCNAIIETANNTLIAGCKATIIPDNVTTIGASAFRQCLSLTAINIPQSVTSIGDNAFKHSGLTSISIPNGVTSIGASAFENCDGLISVTIPASVKTIGDNAFYLSWAITSVTVGHKTPVQLKDGNTISNHFAATLYVPAGSKAAYESAAVWKDFKEIIEIKEETETANHFVLNDTTMRVGQSILFPVALSNESEVTAFQCDIYLPEGISLLTKKGKYDITLDEERVNDQSVSSALQEDGSVRVAVASLTSSTFYGNDGNLLYLNLRADENISGDKVIEIRNISISETDGTRHDLEDVTAVIEVMKYIPADVNNNGTVAIDDVVLTINYLIGDIADNFLFAAGDMNGDNIIKIDDVVMVINALLGDYTPAGVLASSNMTGETMDIRESENGFTMGLHHASEYVAMQYDLILPEGVSLRDIRVTTGSNHTATFRAMGEGEVRVIITSLTNEAFDTAELMEVALAAETDAEITITEAYVVTRTGRLVQVEDAVATLPLGSATGIDAIGAEMNDADLYDLNGRIIRKNTHDKGVYLMNGKKMMVK